MKPSEQPYQNQDAVQPHLRPYAANSASRPPERWARLSRFAIACASCTWGMVYMAVKYLLFHGWSGEQVTYTCIIHGVFPA